MVEIDLSGRRALVVGVTNAHSLGWAIARQLHEAGAELALSYQAETMRSGVEKLAASIGGCRLYRMDVARDGEIDDLFGRIADDWGGLDHLVHAVAFAPRPAMEGRYLDTARDHWLQALEVSAYSLVALARRAEPLMAEGGSVLTLSYLAAERVVPRYNVMAIAKSALESTVRYLASELAPRGIRVNALSPGPMRTVAARSIPGFLHMHRHAARMSPMGRNVSHEEVGRTGLFVLSPLASGITGETIYVDAGYRIMAMSPPEDPGAPSSALSTDDLEAVERRRRGGGGSV